MHSHGGERARHLIQVEHTTQAMMTAQHLIVDELGQMLDRRNAEVARMRQMLLDLHNGTRKCDEIEFTEETGAIRWKPRAQVVMNVPNDNAGTGRNPVSSNGTGVGLQPEHQEV